MQFQSHTASSSHHYAIPWRTQQTQFVAPSLKPKSSSFNARKVSSSLRIDYGPEESLGREAGPATPEQLPVVIQKSGRVSRYFWDGDNLQLVGVDGGASGVCFNFDDGFRKICRICSLAVRDFFIPKKVSRNYLEYVKWKFLHRVFSSALQVLATQAMFRAIGIGYSHSLPPAAALNWVLKDGLGRLSRCVYTASLASAFDTNLKRVRFSTSVMFSLSIGVELLTPVVPKYFLLLASVANIAKQISLACYLATGSAVHRSFAVADNLGEVSAKAQIQTVCFDNLGLLLAVILNMLFKNNQRLQAGLPLVLYPIFSAIDVFGIYRGLKHIHLQTLTKDRLEIIINIWIELGRVPTPAEVSNEEGIDFPWSKGKKLWPIRIGHLNPNNQISKLSTMAMKSIRNDDYYFICMEILYTGLLRRSKQQGILVCLRDGASTANVTMGLLQACYLRKALSLNNSKWEKMMEGSNLSESVLKELFKLIEESKLRAQGDLSPLCGHMLGMGWIAQNILLSSEEQSRYSFVEN